MKSRHSETRTPNKIKLKVIKRIKEAVMIRFTSQIMVAHVCLWAALGIILIVIKDS